MDNFLITTAKSKIIKERNGCPVIYTGGLPEKDWWAHCYEAGIPFIMAYRTGKYWSVKWDDITLQQSGKYIEADDQLYSDIDAVYKRFWKLKSRPVWMGVGLGRIMRLSQEEAVEAAGLISQALNRCIHDKGE